MTNAPALPISHFLEDLHLAPAQRSKQLTVWPLVLNDAFSDPDSPAYVALRSALAHESLRIDEIRDPRGDSCVRVHNTGRVATLCLSGEMIRGATGQRAARASVLVPAAGAAILGLARSSPSTAVCTDSERDRKAIDALLDAFHPIARQVGFVVCRGDRVAGLEAIGRPEVFRSDFRAMLRPYAIAAIERERSPTLPSCALPSPAAQLDGPEALLDALANATTRRSPSTGVGDDYQIAGEQVAGSALANFELVHLTAVPATG